MIYLANFIHATNQQEPSETERRHGEFSMLIQAVTIDQALDMFKQRISDFQKSSNLFEGECSIFLTRILEMENIPGDQALMLNYKSIVGDPILPYIDCSYPSAEADRCRIFAWKDNTPSIDGEAGSLFLKFTP
jgi:hypothetical protein